MERPIGLGRGLRSPDKRQRNPGLLSRIAPRAAVDPGYECLQHPAWSLSWQKCPFAQALNPDSLDSISESEFRSWLIAPLPCVSTATRRYDSGSSPAPWPVSPMAVLRP